MHWRELRQHCRPGAACANCTRHPTGQPSNQHITLSLLILHSFPCLLLAPPLRFFPSSLRKLYGEKDKCSLAPLHMQSSSTHPSPLQQFSPRLRVNAASGMPIPLPIRVCVLLFCSPFSPFLGCLAGGASAVAVVWRLHLRLQGTCSSDHDPRHTMSEQRFTWGW